MVDFFYLIFFEIKHFLIFDQNEGHSTRNFFGQKTPLDFRTYYPQHCARLLWCSRADTTQELEAKLDKARNQPQVSMDKDYDVNNQQEILTWITELKLTCDQDTMAAIGLMSQLTDTSSPSVAGEIFKERKEWSRQVKDELIGLNILLETMGIAPASVHSYAYAESEYFKSETSSSCRIWEEEQKRLPELKRIKDEEAAVHEEEEI